MSTLARPHAATPGDPSCWVLGELLDDIKLIVRRDPPYEQTTIRLRGVDNGRGGCVFYDYADYTRRLRKRLSTLRTYCQIAKTRLVIGLTARGDVVLVLDEKRDFGAKVFPVDGDALAAVEQAIAYVRS